MADAVESKSKRHETVSKTLRICPIFAPKMTRVRPRMLNRGKSSHRDALGSSDIQPSGAATRIAPEKRPKETKIIPIRSSSIIEAFLGVTVGSGI